MQEFRPDRLGIQCKSTYSTGRQSGVLRRNWSDWSRINQLTVFIDENLEELKRERIAGGDRAREWFYISSYTLDEVLPGVARHSAGPC